MGAKSRLYQARIFPQPLRYKTPFNSNRIAKIGTVNLKLQRFDKIEEREHAEY